MTGPEKQTLKASEARQRFAEIVSQAYKSGTRVVVEKNGIPVAAVVSPRDLAQLDRLDQERGAFLEMLRAVREPFEDVPYGELQAEIDRIVALARAAMRAEREAGGPLA